ncbi:uracil phosphoribosyltransferase homolog [Strigops habroptila]|uniref:uracil phosphoribosyltransferase homolog n=1 Tax=Strigops habroptila TaxID=2489341 RepID=UPI0011CFAD46|nr:uracil phosphoribosyltransferase homolog [Strigops habroptila]
MRSGEAMEQGLRDCCRSIRIGKILIQSDEETQRAKVYYAKFPPDIYRRKVLLMCPILSTGNTVIEAVKVLVEHGVQPSVIILLSLFSTPHGKLGPLPSLESLKFWGCLEEQRHVVSSAAAVLLDTHLSLQLCPQPDPQDAEEPA